MTDILFYIRFWFALFFPFLCGFLFLKGSLRKSLTCLPPLLTIALSFLLGIGILPISMLIWGWAGMAFTPFGMMAASIGVTLLCVFCLRSFNLINVLGIKEYRAAADFQRNDILYWLIRIFLFLYIIPISAIIFFKTFSVPFMYFDTIATAGFQTKVFFYSRSLELHPLMPLPSYPMQIPFLLTWMSIILGSWEPILLKVFFPINLFAGCIVFYYVIKKFLGKTVGLLGVILLLSSPFLTYSATVPYRDIFLMNYICIAFALLFFWFYDDNNLMLFFSGIFAGLATFTKSEGILYCLLYCLSFLVLAFKKGNIRKNLYLYFSGSIITAFPAFLYALYKLQRGILLNEKGGFEFNFHRLSVITHVLTRFGEDFFVKPNWGLVIFCFVISLFINIKKLFHGTPAIFFVRVVALFILTCFFISIFGDNPLIVQGLLSYAGLPRVFLHFFPLVVLSVLFLNFEDERITRR